MAIEICGFDSGPYWSTLVHITPYYSILVHIGPYWSILLHIGPHWPILVNAASSVANSKNLRRAAAEDL